MLRLDYLSCLLTIASTILIGRRKWQGWIVAGLNSVIISVIGVRTAQMGFIPANLFCLGIYGYNIFKWRNSSLRDERLSAPRHAQQRRVIGDPAQGPRFLPHHAQTHRVLGSPASESLD